MKNRTTLHPISLAVLMLVLIMSLSQPVMAQDGPVDPSPEPQMALSQDLGFRPVQVYADPNPSTFFQAPPPEFLQAIEGADMTQALASTSFVIDYVPAGQYNLFENEIPCSTFPTEAKTAFNYAANIWSAILQNRTNVPIHIQACWMDMPYDTVLGYSGYITLHSNFANAPVPNVWYPPSLANGLAGADLNGSTPEMVIAYNSDFASQFYYGTGNAPYNLYNLTSVVLHEIAHGLGFAGSMWVDQNGLGSWGWYDGNNNVLPEAYDRFAVNGQGQALINAYSNPSYSLANALTNDNVYFNGPKARAANGNQNVKLHAPFWWDGGSSYSHLDDMYNNTPNALMTYSLARGETNYDPGPITKAMLQDLGWVQPAAPPAAPSSLSLAGNKLYENLSAGVKVGTFSATDPNPGDTLSYALVSGEGSTDNALFSISGNTLYTKAPANYEAKSTLSIRVRVKDQTNRYLDKTFQLTVLDRNEAPTDIQLNPASVLENQPAGTVIGTLTTTDPDSENTHTYTLGCAGADNGMVSVVGNSLRTTAPLDRETKPTLRICVRSKDQGNLYKDKALTITVDNANEVGNELYFAADWIRPGEYDGTTAAGWFFNNDPDLDDSFTYQLTTGGGYADNSLFTIQGDKLIPLPGTNFVENDTYTIQVEYWDASGNNGSGTVVGEFTLTVLTPTNLYLSTLNR